MTTVGDPIRPEIRVEAGKETPNLQWMITSRLTSKAETTIPQAVRAALRLREGDQIVYSIEEGRVVLTRVPSSTVDDPFKTFSGWESDADIRAYASL